MVLSPDSQFFRFFKDAAGKLATQPASAGQTAQ
jgi:membrane protease subunit HflC